MNYFFCIYYYFLNCKYIACLNSKCICQLFNTDSNYPPKWIVTECPQRNCNPKSRKCATARLCRWNFSERFCEGCWWCMEFVRQARQQSVPARAIYRESSCRYEDCNCLPLLTLCLNGFAQTIKSVYFSLYAY